MNSHRNPEADVPNTVVKQQHMRLSPRILFAKYIVMANKIATLISTMFLYTYNVLFFTLHGYFSVEKHKLQPFNTTNLHFKLLTNAGDDIYFVSIGYGR